jgi:hypothetical protein
LNIRSFILTVFTIHLMLGIVSCSKTAGNNKSSTTDSVFGNFFTYTVTDTSGINRSFSDTTVLVINSLTGDTSYLINRFEQNGTAAYIIPWSTTNGNGIKFYFNDIRSLGSTEVNQLILFLPYYQNKITINNGTGNSRFILPLNNVPGNNFEYVYLLNETYYNDLSIINLDKATISTNITDSAGGYISGSFNISAVTPSAKSILVTGSFSHVSGNFHK